MKTKRTAFRSALAAASLAAAVVVSANPASARLNEARYASHESTRPYRAPQHAGAAGMYDSLSQGHQTYANPDRDYFSGVNEPPGY